MLLQQEQLNTRAVLALSASERHGGDQEKVSNSRGTRNHNCFPGSPLARICPPKIHVLGTRSPVSSGTFKRWVGVWWEVIRLCWLHACSVHPRMDSCCPSMSSSWHWTSSGTAIIKGGWTSPLLQVHLPHPPCCDAAERRGLSVLGLCASQIVS